MRSVSRRIVSAVVTAAVSTIAFATSALAYTRDAGEETGPGMSVLETVLWFIVAPGAIMAVVWFLWSIPSWRRSSAPATGDNWNPRPTSELVQK
jgi:hypothetical protein